MVGDGSMSHPQVPDFWLVKFHFTVSFLDIKKVKESFLDLGFRIFDHVEEQYEICIKVCHMHSKYMTLWSLKNQDLIQKNRLKIEYYIHNTRRPKNLHKQHSIEETFLELQR
jgi:hypothetical protein